MKKSESELDLIIEDLSDSDSKPFISWEKSLDKEFLMVVKKWKENYKNNKYRYRILCGMEKSLLMKINGYEPFSTDLNFDERLLESLVKYGFTLNMSKVIASMIYVNRPIAAPVISKGLKMPRTETYFILHKLEKIGIAGHQGMQTNVGKRNNYISSRTPNLYFINNLEDTLKNLVDNYKIKKYDLINQIVECEKTSIKLDGVDSR